ncbi:MAG: dCTP deaminase [Gammaproteobacteria bacterium]|nr:dCTP deaminase [Gammaproteobacteria bacterium]
MQLLTKTEILESLSSNNDDSLFISPLLDIDQIGSVTIDLRLGYDFLVSIYTRKSFIGIGKEPANQQRGISSFFQETRRDVGERFILYPNQVVLTSTLEYVALPTNIYADVISRSSYTRLGVHVNTMMQPGFRGTIPLELFNHGNNAVELVVGSRVCQCRLFRTADGNSYIRGSEKRKYYGDVRPTVSRADMDSELLILDKIKSR